MTSSFGGKSVNDFTEKFIAGELTPEAMDRQYAEILRQAQSTAASSSTLSDDEKATLAAKLASVEMIAESGAGDNLIESQGIGVPVEIDGGTDSGSDDLPWRTDDDDATTVAVELVDETERMRQNAEREHERRATFDAAEKASRDATTSDYESAVDPSLLLADQEEGDVAGDTGDSPDPDDADEDTDSESDEPENSVDQGSGGTSAIPTYTPVAIDPPVPPAVPAMESGVGPVEAPSQPVPSPPPPPASDISSDSYLTDDDIGVEGKRKLPEFLDPVLKVLGKVKAGFMRLPKTLRFALVGLVALIVLINVFGKGGTDTETQEAEPTGQIAVNPNPDKPKNDNPDLIELQPTGGVGSKCFTKDHGPAKAFSKTQGDGWVCPRPQKIDGQFMDVNFGHKVQVYGIEFIPGLWNPHPGGTNDWYSYRNVTQLKVKAPDGQPQPKVITIESPTQAPVRITFDKPFDATQISLVVLATKRPPNPAKAGAESTQDDSVDAAFALSAVRIMGKDPERR